MSKNITFLLHCFDLAAKCIHHLVNLNLYLWPEHLYILTYVGIKLIMLSNEVLAYDLLVSQYLGWSS